MDANESYQGLRPHVDSASAEVGADPNRVVRDSTLASMDHLLCQAHEHQRYGRTDAARATVEGARHHLAELQAIARAGHLAYAEACRLCGCPCDDATPPTPAATPGPDPSDVIDLLGRHRFGEESPAETLNRLIAEAGYRDPDPIEPAIPAEHDEGEDQPRGRKRR